MPFISYANFECLLEPVECDRAYKHNKAFNIYTYVVQEVIATIKSLARDSIGMRHVMMKRRGDGKRSVRECEIILIVEVEREGSR